ncbi:MAG: hypothetical protein M1834_007950 [Cirrosporium novae-zelandiae]|nr:MAG: hypothetical protein M1834_007950 [Cirrosporium novae-zelandiae]
MCGRYAFWIRASQARQQLEDDEMPVNEAPDDDDVRQTYNFAPGNLGLVYRADVPYYGSGSSGHSSENPEENVEQRDGKTGVQEDETSKAIKYKLQTMKWGLIPFWTKRNPDYGSLMKTINCRDDSLAENRGMWNAIKGKKRCLIICDGFYEWLKKNNGRERIPHYIKRADGKLLCLAGLWDCVQYEGSEDKTFTYTIITTSSNSQMKFLHDRMPVVLDNGSDAVRTWLDPKRSAWSTELQSLLKPYDGKLEVYPVSKDVNKVGNDSPTFIIPINSSENKNNIANFFSGAKKDTKSRAKKVDIKKEEENSDQKDLLEYNRGENEKTTNEKTRNNALLSSPTKSPFYQSPKTGSKRSHLIKSKDEEEEDINPPPSKASKTSPSKSTSRTVPAKPGHKTRSATSNGTAEKTSLTKRKTKDGSQKITNFFTK